MKFFKKSEPLNPSLDYGNLNVMLAKQVSELESQIVDLHKELNVIEIELNKAIQNSQVRKWNWEEDLENVLLKLRELK